jgi:hypothetical protein
VRAEVVLDDDDLLRDRLLRTLHKNVDGHLAVDREAHKTAVADNHNAATLFVYTEEPDAFTLHEHYIYSDKPLTYKQWNVNVQKEAHKILANLKTLHGIYGWLTTNIFITPLRNGDLFIKVDKNGAHGVRISFSPRKDKRKACAKATKKRGRSNSNRV